jgi:hypothetical protein
LKKDLMRYFIFLTTWLSILCVFPAHAQIDLGFVLEETAAGSAWTMVYRTGFSPATTHSGTWNSQVVTLCWPDSLGTNFLSSVQNLASFAFEQDGPPTPGGDGYHYLKFVSSAFPVMQPLRPDTILPVLRLALDLPLSLARSVGFAPSDNSWVSENFGLPDVEHARDGNAFHLFLPTLRSMSPPLCGDLTAGTIAITADTSLPLEYSVDSGLTFQSAPIFTGLPPGDYHLAIRKAAEPAVISFSLENPVHLPTPVFPGLLPPVVVQPTCAVPTGQVTLAANGPGTLDFSMDGGLSWQSSAFFAQLQPGTWVPAVRLRSDTTCLLTATQQPVSLVAPLPLPTVTAVSVVQPTCSSPVGTVLVSASGSGALSYSLSAGLGWTANPSFSALPPGGYDLQVRLVSDTTCQVSYAGGSIPIHPVPNPPTISQVDVTQPICSAPAGTVTITATGSGNLQYSLDMGDSWHPTPVFDGLAPASYPVLVRLATDTSCQTAYGLPVQVAPPPALPIIEQIQVIQPTCAAPTGTIAVFAAGASSLQYSLDDGTSWSAAASFPGLPPGGFPIRVRLAEDLSCVTAYAGNPVVVNDVPMPPVITDVSVVQPTCATSYGTALVSATSMGQVEYSVQGTSGWQSAALFPFLSAGIYTPAVRLVSDNSCVGLYPAGFEITSPPTPPTIQSVAVTQPTECTQPTGQVTVLATAEAPLEYQLHPGTGVWQTDAYFPTVLPGSWQVRVRLASDSACVVSHSANPVTVDTLPGCCLVPSFLNSCLSGDYISSFRFGSFEHNSQACDQPGMGNYSVMAEGPSVVMGSSYLVRITVSPTQSQFVGFYLDLDQNGSFLDSGEFYNFGYVPAGATIQASYTIPYTARPGWTKIRVRSQRNPSLTAADGCATVLSYGETEDYPVFIDCPVVSYVNGNPIQAGTYVAANSLYASGKMAAGESLSLRAGNDLTLEPGFELPPTATLEMWIQGCWD